MIQTPSIVTDLMIRVARDGAVRAGRALSGLVGQEISIHVPAVRICSTANACDEVGGGDAIVLGSYLQISGDISGHVMLLFPVSRALECADLMCGEPVGTTKEPDDLVRSAIGELGNIVGSAFINALADETNLILHPSPPIIVHDLAIALVETIYAEILSQGGDAVIIDTIFEDKRGNTAGLLFLTPNPDCFGRLEELAG